MPTTFERLVHIRSRLVEEVLEYLDALAKYAARLPPYYPEHLRTSGTGKTRFDNVRQVVQVVEDRSAFERCQAEEMERTRAAGQGFERTAYKPTRARAEFRVLDERRSDLPAPLPCVVWDECAGERFKRAIILGDPGFGKTWLLRYEARRLAGDAKQQLGGQHIGLGELVLPVFARLWEVNRKDIPLEEELVDFVVGKRSDAFRRFVEEKLKSDRCVILLDAWDEVPVKEPKAGQPLGHEPGSQQLLRERLQTFADHFPRPRLLLTSRIVGYDSSHPPLPNLQELELLAFDTPQTESFVSVWFGDDTRAANQCLAMLRRNPQVRGLARIPLMLTLLCRTYIECQEKQGDFPARRVELYDHCLSGLLRDWKIEKHLPFNHLKLINTLSRLAGGAFKLHAEQKEQFTEPELARALGFDLERDDDMKKAVEFIETLKRDGILITAGEHRDAPLLFLHRTFHEYLTARTLARIVNERKKGWHTEIEVRGERMTVKRLLEKKAWDQGWQEVIVLLAGQLEDPSPLLEMLSNPDPTSTNPHGDDIFRHRLALASLCLPEINSKCRARLAELIDEIATTAFSLWYDNHRSPTRAATPAALSRALPALIQVNGQKNGVPLLEWVCQNLSSEDEEEQAAAVEALSSLGSAAATPGVLGRLAQLLQGPVNDEWQSGLQAVLGIGGAAVKPEILSPLVQKLHKGKLEHDYDANISYDLTERLEDVLANLLLNSDSSVEAVAILTQLARSLQYPDLLKDMESALWNMGRVIMSILIDPDFADQELSSDEVLVRLLQDPEVRAWYTDLKAIFAPSYVPRYTAPIFWSMVLRGKSGSFADMDQWLKPTIFTNLTQWLNHHNMDERCKAAREVIEIGSAAASPEILTGLARLLQTRIREIQFAEANAMARLLLEPDPGASANPDVLARLAQLLQDENPDIKFAVARVSRAIAWSGFYFFNTGGGIKPMRVGELA